MTEFQAPSAIEALFNQTFGFLVGLGIGPKFIYLLEVRGRKTGKIYSAPVNMMDLGRKLYLVAPRGRANWVRNAEAAGEVTLKRGSSRKRAAGKHTAAVGHIERQTSIRVSFCEQHLAL